MSLFINTYQYAAILKKKTPLLTETAECFPINDLLHIENFLSIIGIELRSLVESTVVYILISFTTIWVRVQLTA